MQTAAPNKLTTELVEFLSNPATYSGRPEVESIETHISHVFLAGEDVYKLKKPVKFEFLDFSTEPKRKQACEDEVRLNRRMAPSVYLGVMPVRRRAAGKLSIGEEDGPVVDWLVHMRRLDEGRVLARQFRNSDDESNVEQIEKVAKYLGAFYSGQAPATVRTDEFVRRLRLHIEENQKQLLELAQSQTARDKILCVHSAQLRFLVTHRELFDSRVLDGRIVDGHGDLRPDHIYLYKSPLVIDCIEFNTEYRTNDVVDELAFLAMCCDKVGETSVGPALFDAYEQHSGDVCSPQLINFYKAYRACVRAKVAGLCSQQVTSARAGDFLDKEFDYLDLASQYCKLFDQRFVLIVGGLMGSGKSTLARQLQKLLSAELVSSDAVREAFFNSAGEPSDTSDPPEYGTGKYAPSARTANYKRMMDRAHALLHRNHGIIFDGTFTRQDARRMIAGFAAMHGCRILQVECECPREEAIARISERVANGGSTSEAVPEHYDQQVAEAQPLLDTAPFVRVDATQSLPEECETVLKALVPLIADSSTSMPNESP